MPNYVKRKKILSKRTRKTRLTRYRKRRLRPYIVAPPPKQNVCLKYVETLTGQLTSVSAYSQTVWRCNDTYDPNYTSAGHQSMFRDQFFAMYSFSRCPAWSIYIKIMSDSNIPTECVLYPNDTFTTAAHTDAREYRGASKGFVTLNKPLTLKYRALTDRFLQNKRYTVFTDDKFKQGPSAALSDEATCWMMLSYYYTGSSSSVNLTWQISIRQYTQFSEAKAVTGS